MSENITVLIPAYNASKTIRKTIDAILNQTYDSSLIKIVICNDGSTDNTLDILNDYQDKYPNKIRVITQENKGLSITRKILLEYVETKWCCFCDADDYYTANAFSEMIKSANCDTDIIVSKIIWYQKNTFIRSLFANLFNKKYTLQKYINKCDYGYIWNKLYRYEFIKQINPHFFERIRMLEDLFISVQLLDKNPKIALCTRHTYFYTKSKGSMSLGINNDDCNNFIKLYEWVSKNINNKELITNFYLTCKFTLKYIKKSEYIEQLNKIGVPELKKLTWWRKIIS